MTTTTTKKNMFEALIVGGKQEEGILETLCSMKEKSKATKIVVKATLKAIDRKILAATASTTTEKLSQCKFVTKLLEDYEHAPKKKEDEKPQEIAGHVAKALETAIQMARFADVKWNPHKEEEEAEQKQGTPQASEHFQNNKIDMAVGLGWGLFAAVSMAMPFRDSDIISVATKEGEEEEEESGSGGAFAEAVDRAVTTSFWAALCATERWEEMIAKTTTTTTTTPSSDTSDMKGCALKIRGKTVKEVETLISKISQPQPQSTATPTPTIGWIIGKMEINVVGEIETLTRLKEMVAVTGGTSEMLMMPFPIHAGSCFQGISSKVSSKKQPNKISFFPLLLLFLK